MRRDRGRRQTPDQTAIWQRKNKSSDEEYQKFRADTITNKRTSPLQKKKKNCSTETRCWSLRLKVFRLCLQKQAKTQILSMTPTLEENIKNVESKIKGIPPVSAKAGSNPNTVSMTPTLELKNTKRVRFLSMNVRRYKIITHIDTCARTHAHGII